MVITTSLVYYVWHIHNDDDDGPIFVRIQDNPPNKETLIRKKYAITYQEAVFVRFLVQESPKITAKAIREGLKEL